jgi:death-on-curing protein
MRWLGEDMLVALQSELVAQHGGLQGVRDEGVLFSVLVHPMQLASCGETTVFDLAAAYTCGIITNRPFIDANPLAGFLSAYIFMDLNGWQLNASEAWATVAVLSVVEGEFSEAHFAQWLERHSIPKGVVQDGD